MPSSPDAVCTGLVVADHVCAPVDHFPAPGELVMCDRMLLTIGGGAANTGIDLAKLGISTSVAAGVGDDAFGMIAREILKSHGIDTSAVMTNPEQPTSQTLIINVKGQDRRFIHTPGAYGSYRATDIPLELVKQSKVLFIGYLLLMPSLDDDELVKVLEAAHAAGAIVVADVAVPDRRDYIPSLKKILPHVDVFLPNDDEGRLILNEPDPIRQAEAFHRMGAGTVAITMGGKGSILISNQLRLRASVYPVQFVDGTGGGDAFDAGYIYGLLNGMGPQDCLRYASAMGASCVRGIGTTPSVFNEKECKEFVATHELSILPV